MRQPEFIYLDLGNVICTFDNQRACAQMARIADTSEAQLRDFFGEHDFQNKLERGEVKFPEVATALASDLGKRIDANALEHAYSDIFGLVPGIVPLVARMAAANLKLGVLSNTSAPHWSLLTSGTFALLPSYFDRFALSFEIGLMKPDAGIYESAQKIAAVPAERIFFTDDRAENIEAAKAAGWDAVQFESPLQLARALHQRGVEFNY